MDEIKTKKIVFEKNIITRLLKSVFKEAYLNLFITLGQTVWSQLTIETFGWLVIETPNSFWLSDIFDHINRLIT